MGYGLGVDLGTTHTAAAVNADGRIDPVRLGSHKLEMPSLVFLRPDGGVLVGEAAQRRGQLEPGRLAREFKRRMGDPVPIMLGGTPFSAHALTARLLAHVIETVTQLRDGAPDRIVVTHPANWGPYKRELLGQAIQLADLTGVQLRPEPTAAAVRYAGTERVATGEIVAVYDLGGGTFDAAVLRKSADGFDLLGEPEGIEQLGGIDFDEAVLEHVRTTLGDVLTGLDPEDDDTNAALARLRRECVEAKETLSYDTEAVVGVALPRMHTRVRINRSQFEAMIAPALADTVAAMRRALRSAEVGPEQLRSIVLAGGSSRIPLVSEVLSTAFERRVVLDETPELGIALGAARLAGPEVAEAVGVREPARAVPASTAKPASPAKPAPARSAPAELPQPGVMSPAKTPGSPSSTQRGASPTPAVPTIVGRAAAPASPGTVDGRAAASPALVRSGRWRRYLWAAVGAGVAAVLAVVAVLVWPEGDPPANTPRSTGPPTAVAASLRWQVPTGRTATGSPVTSDDRVFVGGTDGVIRAFVQSDGRADWTYDTGADRVLVSRVLDDMVYAGTSDGVLHAVDAETGEQRWRRATGDTFLARPSVFPNHIYVGGGSGALYSYFRGRNQRWRQDSGGEIRTSPVSAGSVAVFASEDRRLYAVNTQGSLEWSETVGRVVDTPAPVDREVCVAIDDGSISCRKLADGSLASKITSESGPLSGPVGLEATIYAGSADGTIGAWEPETGQQRWQLRRADGVAGAGRLALLDGTLYVAYPDGRVSAIDPTAGAERWQFTVDEPVAAAPWANGGSVFVVGESGTLYALQAPA